MREKAKQYRVAYEKPKVKVKKPLEKVPEVYRKKAKKAIVEWPSKKPKGTAAF